MGRILLFGQAKFGARVLEELLGRGHEIVAAALPPPRPGRPDPLAEAARAAGVPVLERRSYKGGEAYEALRPERADLGVLAYVTQIIDLAILDAPRHASVCFHPSLLPAYRGGSAINWQIIRGETRGGVTLFRPDAGIDSGPIYLQREVEIGPDDTAGSYYYGKLFEIGVEATIEAVEAILAGRARPVPQDERRATYDPLCRDEHAFVDWSRPAAELHNLIRGCDPSPGAHTEFEGRRLRLFGSRREAGAPGALPGTVLAVGEDGLRVAAGDGVLRIERLSAGEGKRPAAEIAHALGLAAGAVLGAA